MISFSLPVTRHDRDGRRPRSPGPSARTPAASPGPGERPVGRFATGCWAGLIVVAFGVGAVLRGAGALPVDPFPPLHAHPRLLLGPLLPAAALGVAAVAVLPAAAGRLAWRPLLLVAWLGSAAWSVALAAPDGLARPLTARTEYLAGLPAIGDDPLRWLRGFAGALQAYPTHVKGHPPLPTLVLWALQRAGLGGAGWAAALVIAAGTSATVAIAVTVRALAGEDTARRAVPFLVLAPTVLWVATSVDALFLGVGAWGVALAVLAATGPSAASPMAGASTAEYAAGASVPARPRRRAGRCGMLGGGRGAASSERPAPGRAGAARRTAGAPAASVVAAFAGGTLLGSVPYLNYGLLPFFALPAAVLLLTRPARRVMVALAVGCLTVPAAFTLAGFSWFDGVAATHAAWAAGAGSRRPYAYFLVGDLAVFALLVGPATARALPSVLGRAVTLVRISPFAIERDGRPRAERLGWLAAAALAGVLALDLSGVTRGEVERIWIPYAPWLISANAAHRAPGRALLLAQAATALAVQALVRSPW